jgi:hypothetical protein
MSAAIREGIPLFRAATTVTPTLYTSLVVRRLNKVASAFCLLSGPWEHPAAEGLKERTLLTGGVKNETAVWLIDHSQAYNLWSRMRCLTRYREISSMPCVHVDPARSDDALRKLLYSGDVIIKTNLPSVGKFVEFTRHELAVAFAPHDPQHVHEVLGPAEIASILAVWKPQFIHNETSKALTRAIIIEAGFDPERTHFDVPKPRTAYPVGHLTTGIAYAFPWHRDTWYGASQSQINWWFPIWEPKPDNAMAFDLPSFDRAVPNDSHTLNYYQANKDRLNAAQYVKSDLRARPGALNWHPASEFIPILSPGAIILFSGSQLHKTIPNTSGLSRYSVDFRTIDRLDVEAGVGAPAHDVNCTGTALRDFVGVASGERIDENLARQVEGAPPPDDAILVFDSEIAKQASGIAKSNS